MKPDIGGIPQTLLAVSHKKVFSVIIRYLILLIMLTLIFTGSLFIAGLGGASVQKKVRINIKNSIDQLETEGLYPVLINRRDQSNRMDNFTDSIILMQCLHMDTVSKPDSIFANRDFLGNAEVGTDKISALKETVRTGETNRMYDRYWIGIRAIVRPLLIFYTYPQIRNILSVVMICLLFLSTEIIRKYTGPWLAAGFLVSMFAVNIVTVSYSLQFIPCFLVSFLAVILLPAVRRSRGSFTIPMFFFVIGATTQFLDFYTAPPITCCIPMVFLLALESGKSRADRIKAAAMCLVGWALGYGLLWITKLLLSSIFVGHGTLLNGLQSFGKWTGASSGGEKYDKFTVPYVFKLVFDYILSQRNRLIFFGFLTAVSLCAVFKAKQKELRAPDPVLLIPALLPLVWITVARRATGNHIWFQYRQMTGFVFSVLCFVGSTVSFGLDDIAGSIPDESSGHSRFLSAIRQTVDKQFSPEAVQARKQRQEEMEHKVQKARQNRHMQEKADFYLSMGQSREQTVESIQELLKVGMEIRQELEAYCADNGAARLQTAQRMVEQRMAEQQKKLEELQKSEKKTKELPYRGL